jgi:glutathione S-transferase
MALVLHAHPLSSYCQKVLTALYENGTPFEFRMVNLGDPQSAAELAALWPMKRMPVLVDDGRTVVESSIIVEHLDANHPGPTRFVPADPAAALEVRLMDRVFDLYVMTPMQKVVFDALRPADAKDALGVAAARAQLDTIYGWLDERLAGRAWAAGDAFTLADCAAAPSLLYAQWTHPIPERHAALLSYRKRLLARPSYARALAEARPYRQFFPLGAPETD